MVVAQSTEEQREPGGEDCFQSTQSRTAMRLIASTLHQMAWLTFGFLFARQACRTSSSPTSLPLSFTATPTSPTYITPAARYIPALSLPDALPLRPDRLVCVYRALQWHQWNEIAQDDHIYKQLVRRCYPGSCALLRSVVSRVSRGSESPQGGWKSQYLRLRTCPSASPSCSPDRLMGRCATHTHSQRECEPQQRVGELWKLWRGVVAVRPPMPRVRGGPAAPARAQPCPAGARHPPTPRAAGLGQGGTRLGRLRPLLNK